MLLRGAALFRCHGFNASRPRHGSLFHTRKLRDPLSLVRDEVLQLADSMRSMVISDVEVSELAAAADYFFRSEAGGKKICSHVALLMASSLGTREQEPARAQQQCIAKITEMIHVASLVHDDVLDGAERRRGIGSLNSVVGNKLAVFAGDLILSRALAAASSLANAEVVSFLATALEDLVSGEIMQMTATPDQRQSMEYYLHKTYCKTAALVSNSCRCVAVLAGHGAEVSDLAYQYGRNLGIAYQLMDDVLDFAGEPGSLGKSTFSDIRNGIVTAPILLAMEEIPELRELVRRGFVDHPADVEAALQHLAKSSGIERARELAVEHAERAAAAVRALPENSNEGIVGARLALIDLTLKLTRRVVQ